MDNIGLANVWMDDCLNVSDCVCFCLNVHGDDIAVNVNVDVGMEWCDEAVIDEDGDITEVYIGSGLLAMIAKA